MVKKNSLGKGLGAIFSDLIDDSIEKPTFITCGIEELVPNRFQARKVFDGEEQKSLIESIKKSGIIQPIVVRKSNSGYEIIAGERRWRAAQAARLKNVPIIIMEADDRKVAELSLVENIQREDLNPIEEAHAYHTLASQFQLSQEDISERTGKDRSTIANSLRLLKLSRLIQDALVKKELSAGHARAILSLDTEEDQKQIFKAIQEKKLSVREAERLARNLKSPAREKKETPKSETIVEIENQLSTKLMTLVTIQQTSRGGTIRIRYRGLEELSRIMRDIMENDIT